MSERAEATLRMMSRLGRLEVLPRTGWLFSGVVQPESVAAHSFEVLALAMWLADQIDEPVDMGRLARIAVAHDASEALLTDLPKPTKHWLSEEAVAQAERRATARVFEHGSEEWQGAWEEYDARESVEARLVKAADTLQMLIKALSYEAQGRGDVRRFFRPERPDFGFPIVGEIYASIARHRRDGTWYVSDVD